MRPQLRKHRQLKTVTLRTIMLTGSIKPVIAESLNAASGKSQALWTIMVVTLLYIVNSVHRGPVGVVGCEYFFP